MARQAEEFLNLNRVFLKISLSTHQKKSDMMKT